MEEGVGRTAEVHRRLRVLLSDGDAREPATSSTAGGALDAQGEANSETRGGRSVGPRHQIERRPELASIVRAGRQGQRHRLAERARRVARDLRARGLPTTRTAIAKALGYDRHLFDKRPWLAEAVEAAQQER